MTLFTKSDAEIEKALVLAEKMIEITPFTTAYQPVEMPGSAGMMDGSVYMDYYNQLDR